MKRIIFLFVFGIMSLASFGQTNFTNMSEVVQCEGMNTATIYSNIMQNWSSLQGAVKRSENNLDYCDKDAGIINIKGRLFVGFHKSNMLCGYEGFANTMVTFKIKDNRYKVTMIINDINFEWTAKQHPDNHTIKINELFPEYTYNHPKGNMYIRKAATDIAYNQMPSIINLFFENCKKLHINTEDDF